MFQVSLDPVPHLLTTERASAERRHDPGVPEDLQEIIKIRRLHQAEVQAWCVESQITHF
jgi:hypothetical protein